MDESSPSELLCSLCDEMCKRGAQMKCCGTRACRACAVLKINKTRRCWNEDCGEENITTGNHLNNDDFLRTAVEYFKKKGKMAPAHKKILKIRDEKGLGKKQIGKDVKKKKVPFLNVSNKSNVPCGFGEKCRRKRCQFFHVKPTLGDEKKAAETRERNPAGKGKSCKFGALCTKMKACKFNHPDVNKPCSFGAGCTRKSGMCNYSSFSEAEHQAMSALEVDRKQIGSDFGMVLLNGNPMNGGLGSRKGRVGGLTSDGREEIVGGRIGDDSEEMEGGVPSMKMSDTAVDNDVGGHYTNPVQMQKMKQELDSMMSNAARYGILPSYDRILGVVNGINTAISN